MNAPSSAVSRGVGFLFSGSSSNNWFIGLLLLCARVYAGFVIMMKGSAKLPVPDFFLNMVEGFQIQGTALFAEAAPIFAFLAVLAEFSGGFLLMVGLFTRWAAFFLAVTLGFAAYGFQDPSIVPFIEMNDAASLSWIFVTFLAVGPGVFSFDSWARRASTPTAEGEKRKSAGVYWFLILVFLGSIGCPIYRQYFAPTADAAPTDAGEEQVEEGEPVEGEPAGASEPETTEGVAQEATAEESASEETPEEEGVETPEAEEEVEGEEAPSEEASAEEASTDAVDASEEHGESHEVQDADASHEDDASHSAEEELEASPVEEEAEASEEQEPVEETP